MNLLWAGLIVAAVVTVAVAALMLVRRRAPEGGYFEDGDRAAGVFGVLATGFSVLVGFVVFLAFESFETSRTGAEAEARIVAQQFETAQFLPATVRARLSGELVCYARYVVSDEWPRLETGELGESLNAWGVAMFRTIRSVEPKLASEQTGYDKWFDQRFDREAARSDRIHGAVGVIPTPLWIVLFLSAFVIFAFMLLFADPAERRFVQATMIGGVAVVITSLLALLWFLNNPFHAGVGGLRPDAMERALVILEEEAAVVGAVSLPCDSFGNSRG